MVRTGTRSGIARPVEYALAPQDFAEGIGDHVVRVPVDIAEFIDGAIIGNAELLSKDAA